MTDITYKGGNCLAIQTKNTLLVTDPVTPGIKSPKESVKTQVVLVTQEKFRPAMSSQEQRIFSLPGEYELGDFSITGLPAESQLDPDVKATAYRIVTSEVRLATLGHINPDKIDDSFLEELGVVDVLALPVGGNGYTIDAHGAAKLVRRIDPKVVIPVHYKEDGIDYEVPQASLDDFAKELGVQPQEAASFKIKQAGQLPETLTLLQLSL